MQLYGIASFNRNVPNVGTFIDLPAATTSDPLELSTVNEHSWRLRLNWGMAADSLGFLHRLKAALKSRNAFW